MKFGYRDIFVLFALFLLLCSVRLGLLMLPKSQPQELSKQELKQELYQLLDWLQKESAFYALLSSDKQKHWQQQLVSSLLAKPGLSIVSYTDTLQTAMAQLGDPGMRLGSHWPVSQQFDIKFAPVDGRWLVTDQQDKPLLRHFPFVTHIDGVPIAEISQRAGSQLVLSLRSDPDAIAPVLSQLQRVRDLIGLDIRRPPRLTLTNELGVTNRTFWLASQSATTKPTASRDNRLSYLSADAALLSVANLDKLNKAQLMSALNKRALILDIRHARGKKPLLLNMLIAALKGERTLPSLHSRYKVWGSDNKRSLQALGFNTNQHSDSEISAVYSTDIQGMSPILSKTFDAKPGLNSPLEQLVLISGPECRQMCAQITYLARHLPGVTLAGSTFAGDFSPRSQLTLHHSGLTLRASTSLFYADNGSLLSGHALTPDIAFSRHQPLQWQALTALLYQSAQWQLTASD